MKLKKIIVWLIISAILLPVCSYTMTMAHENTHKVICDKFGGEVIAEHYEIFGESSILCAIENIKYKGEYKIAQSNVEAFGYQLQTFMTCILTIIMVIGSFIIIMEKD